MKRKAAIIEVWLHGFAEFLSTKEKNCRVEYFTKLIKVVDFFLHRVVYFNQALYF